MRTRQTSLARLRERDAAQRQGEGTSRPARASIRSTLNPPSPPTALPQAGEGRRVIHSFAVMLALGLSLVALPAIAADSSKTPSVVDAWKMLPRYEHGQDMAPLLTIDRAVIASMGNPAARKACAARLASLLEKPQTTAAAQQYICLQLRQVGTPAEVPVLARLLLAPKTSEKARYALESIPGDESLAALRQAAGKLHGPSLVGVVQSLGARRDQQSEPMLEKMAGSKDAAVATASLWALGEIGNPQAIAFLTARADAVKGPLPPELAVPLVRCAESLLASGERSKAGVLFDRLARAGQPTGVRRAALVGLLRLKGDHAAELLVSWFLQGDADQRRLAAGHLNELSDADLDILAKRLPTLDDDGKVVVLRALATRKGKAVLPLVLDLVKSKDEASRLAGLRLMGMLGDASAIPPLVEALRQGGPAGEAACSALVHLPRHEVADSLLKVLHDRPSGFAHAIEPLVQMKCYDAIDPLIAMAASDDVNVYGPALEGLRGIADPDQVDVPRLVKLLLRTPHGKRRDEIEKTILIVCDKVPARKDRAGPVLQAIKSIPGAQPAAYLPLLGRLGGPQAKRQIDAAMAASDPALQEAAIRALCNWPNADVADRLLEIATGDRSESHRQWALRAYIRVVSLPSGRAEADTLAMLQKAMKLALRTEDQRLVLQRAGAVRTMESVEWIATYLDKPELAQSACEALVELAHHRFLRHPNMKRFDPILKRVAEISKDPEVVERAKRYRLGL